MKFIKLIIKGRVVTNNYCLQDSFNGKSCATPIITSDIPIKVKVNNRKLDTLYTMFVTTPIRDKNNNIIAVLTIRLNPYTGIYNILRNQKGDDTSLFLYYRDGSILSVNPNLEEFIKRKISDINPKLLTHESSGIHYLTGSDGNEMVVTWTWLRKMNLGIMIGKDKATVFKTLEYTDVFTKYVVLFCSIIILLLSIISFIRCRKLSKAEAFLGSIIQTASDPIFLLDNKGVVFNVNESTLTLLGYSKDEIIGLHVKQIIPNYGEQNKEEDNQESNSNTSKILLNHIRTEAIKSDGNRIPVALSVNQISPITGTFFSCFLKDLTEEQKIHDSLIAANHAKTMFLATMSHEIRTPLNGIISSLDLLNITKLNDSQRELLEISMKSSSILIGIINDILDFSKIETEKLELERRNIKLEREIEDVMESLIFLIRSSGVMVYLYIDPKIGCIIGDPVRIKQIIYNLVGNAIKFTSQDNGKIIVTIKVEEETETNISISINVTDNGIGMDEEAQKKLFHSFYQAEKGTTRKFGGSGLGLAITKKLVDKMEGTIKVSSTKHVGTSFDIQITFDKCKDSPKVEYKKFEDTIALLITEDQKTQHTFTSYLEYSGVKVMAVSSAITRGFISDLSNNYKNIIIIIDALKNQNHLFRTFKEYQTNLKFILLTKREASYSQNNQYVLLNLNVMKRSKLISAVCSLIGIEVDIRDRDPKLIGPDNTDKPQKLGKLVLLVDDNAINQKIISLQLISLGFDVEVAYDGKVALDMWRQKKYDVILTDCHMPVLNGYEFTRAVRNEEKEHKQSPIVIVGVTADILDKTKEECFASGMNAYISKPFTTSKLYKELYKLGVITDEPTKVDEQKSIPEIGDSDEFLVEPEVFETIVGKKSPEELKEFYKEFLDNLKEFTDKTRKYFAEKNIKEIEEVSHTLKSSAKMFGAMSLAECVEKINQAAKDENFEIIEQEMASFDLLSEKVIAWVEDYIS